MPYFLITVSGEAPKPWERTFEASGPTSACALLQLCVDLGAFANERLLRNVHIGAPHDVSVTGMPPSSYSMELPLRAAVKDRGYSSEAEQGALNAQVEIS